LQSRASSFAQDAKKCFHNGMSQFGLGVDVMITLFCYFCQFSAKNLRFSQKIKILAKTSSSLSKNVNIFAKFFGENI
jgi:hypothetical protein